MTRGRRHLSVFLIYCWSLACASLAQGEALRILVPQFFGPEPISQQVRTSVYFDVIKAFRAIDTPDKGGWILYGQEPVAKPTHDAVLATASWPSVHADLAVWGQVQPYGDGVVLQLYLSLSPLIQKRKVRPELWHLKLLDADGVLHEIKRDLPGRFYTFEPLPLTRQAIVQFSTPQGIKLYATRNGNTVIGAVGEVMRFHEIQDEALLITTDGKRGWVRSRAITEPESEAMNFVKGMVRLLRGDWRGARQSFTAVLADSASPQELRIDAMIYKGLAQEKSGLSGRSEFEEAVQLNRLDRYAAAYLLMSHLAEVGRLQQSSDPAALSRALGAARERIASSRMLFPADDPWIVEIEHILEKR